MNILFEDDYILVCIKPCGLLSQSDSKGGESMISLLENHCGGSVYPIHRLDREVGGIMVYAKTKNSAAILSRDIAEQKLKKEYIALVHGIPKEAKGKMVDLLFKDGGKNKSFVVKRERKGVKKASLQYETVNIKLFDNEPYSVVKILLHTGRTHQIRVQFSSRKIPLAGDRKYGAKDNFNNIGLWSYQLTFLHPLTKKVLTFSCEPENFIKDFM